MEKVNLTFKLAKTIFSTLTVFFYKQTKEENPQAGTIILTAHKNDQIQYEGLTCAALEFIINVINLLPINTAFGFLLSYQIIN